MPPPDVTKLEGYEPPPSDLDYVTAQAGKDATAARDTAAQVVGGAATQGKDLETLKDAATMVPAGATMDWDDELMGHLGAIGEALGNPLEDPKAAAQRGYRMQRDAQRGRKAIAMKRSPYAAPIGYLGGAVAQQAVAGPLLRGGTGVLSKAAQYATGTARAAEGAGVGTRALVGAGNAAVPGAIIGAGQAESLEDVPGNAATGAVLGAGASALMHAPGAVRRMTGHPAVAKAADAFADDAFLRAGGLNKGQITKLADKPGGKKGYIKRVRDLDIGNDPIPTNQRIEEQATAVAEKLQAENQALADQAANITVPREEIADELAQRASRFASDGDADIIRHMGRMEKRFRSGGEKSFPELVQDRQAYHTNAFKSRTDTGQRTRRETGAAINDILERHANKLPGEIGTPWRGNNAQLSTAIDAIDYASAGQGGSNLGKGLKLGTGLGSVALGALTSPVAAVPGLVGVAATVPGVQMRMAQGLGAISRAAARTPSSLERILNKYVIPSGQNAGRLVAHGQAQEGITAVQEAALQGDEAAVTKHYELMMTNPEYNRMALEEENP